MKLRLISEIQYRQPDTSNERTNSSGVLQASAVNDQYHIKRSRVKKKSPRSDNSFQHKSLHLDPLHSAGQSRRRSD